MEVANNNTNHILSRIIVCSSVRLSDQFNGQSFKLKEGWALRD